jgi:sec-independent protein translocase protein TatA
MVVASILGPDMVVLVAVIALLFGGTQLPKLARGLGSASREFRKGVEEGEPEVHAPKAATVLAEPVVLAPPAVVPAKTTVV